MDETETDDVVTVGQRLREARESSGMAIDQRTPSGGNS